MHSRRIATLLVIGSDGGIVACERDPAVSTDLEDADSFAALIADGGTGPFLLEMARVPDPALIGCARAVETTRSAPLDGLEALPQQWTVRPQQGGRMYNRRIAAFLVIGSVGGVIACENDPAVSTDLDDSASFAVSAVGSGGPFLLELAEEPWPALLGCADAVNNEGMISGWHVISVGGGTIDVVARWDRTGKFIRSGARGGYQERIWVIDMNDRGQVLSRVRAGPLYEVRVENADGSGFMMPQTYSREISHDPVRMNRAGDVMATYWLNPDCWYTESCPIEDILTTHLGWLDPPFTPPWGSAGLCAGETIDDNRAVYGLCAGKHYRWTTRDNAAPFPSGPDRIIGLWIHDINRYGELVGRTPAGPIFWSQATGRIQIPMPPGVTQLEPVAINDRGEVLLASDYVEGPTQPAQTVAYWTKSSGTVVLPRKGWPTVAVRDINNQGVIAGCVGGDGGKELIPAYWRIR